MIQNMPASAPLLHHTNSPSTFARGKFYRNELQATRSPVTQYVEHKTIPLRYGGKSAPDLLWTGHLENALLVDGYLKLVDS